MKLLELLVYENSPECTIFKWKKINNFFNFCCVWVYYGSAEVAEVLNLQSGSLWASY